ncbi:hydrogenase formation protein HypD [Rhodocyclus tenuis]|uniref:Hydrogenase maturation factor n=1 Tax=Rhodocyclus tenuis TaxID=1066 RepID=A0A840GJC2_RHOTE|nr:hydrogenase formation protein HypD [Rhodocyclus tenuis]MBB4248542.1 hydrogenase expression/formation protein HypD [Rhodocyclus tenuis]
MKYIDEFRDGPTARALGAAIARAAQSERSYRIMEFCGGHTHAISRYGIADLLPANLRLIHGPGCPVCVLPIGRVDSAIELALQHGVILCAYGDCLRVPASAQMSLQKAKARGADVRMVHSAADALKTALDNPQRQVVFFAIGFETTTPPTAVVIEQASRLALQNFTVFCNHVLTPPAIAHLLAASAPGAALPAVELDAFIGPAHVSTVIGSQAYEPFVARYRKPVVIAGFEPLDVMQAILMLVQQLNAGRAEVENQYTRAVTRSGNLKAQRIVAEVFELRSRFEWRGLGELPASALRIRERYAAFDAEQRFGLLYRPVADNRACECGAILRGLKQPRDCKVFGTACTPENPLGSCMVSSEGACAAHYSYGRYRDFAAQESA